MWNCGNKRDVWLWKIPLLRQFHRTIRKCVAVIKLMHILAHFPSSINVKTWKELKRKITFFKVNGQGKFLRICISLMTFVKNLHINVILMYERKTCFITIILISVWHYIFITMKISTCSVTFVLFIESEKIKILDSSYATQ